MVPDPPARASVYATGKPYDTTAKKWGLRLVFYAVYYCFLYALFHGYRSWYISSREMETRNTPVRQAPLGSAKMTIFPIDYVYEKDFASAKKENTLNFGSTQQAMYKGNSEKACNWPVFGCDGWKSFRMNEAYELEFAERLAQIQKHIDAATTANDCSLSSDRKYCSPIVPGNGTYTDQVKEFCGADAMAFKNNKACLFVGLTPINSWVPKGLSTNYQMGKKLNGAGDKKIEDQLQWTNEIGSDNVYFGCRLFKTTSGKFPLKDDKQAPFSLSDGNKHITWMGDQNYIPSYYYPKTNQNPDEHIKRRATHRFALSDWYRPELVMKVDLSSASNSIAFDCNAYADNIITPMLSADASGTQIWKSRAPKPQPHQSFVFTKA